MHTKKGLLSLLLSGILLVSLSACIRQVESSSLPSNFPQSSTPASISQETTSQENSSQENISLGNNSSEAAQPESPENAANEAILYIGTRESGFNEYPMTYEGDLTPEILIAGIGELTGWDMTLAEEVTTGKGGMSVCFADSSALFMGPPEPQKEEFFMFAADQLAQTILDSTQKTLQMGFTGKGGNPDALDIYYYMEGEKPLEIPNIGRTWPLDRPYAW